VQSLKHFFLALFYLLLVLGDHGIFCFGVVPVSFIATICLQQFLFCIIPLPPPCIFTSFFPWFFFFLFHVCKFFFCLCFAESFYSGSFVLAILNCILHLHTIYYDFLLSMFVPFLLLFLQCLLLTKHLGKSYLVKTLQEKIFLKEILPSSSSLSSAFID